MVAYRRPPSMSRTKGGPYTGANTKLLPPITTDFSGLRACWVNCAGAVEISLRAKPRGMRTRSPSTDAPAARQRSKAAGLFTKLTPTSSRMVSAFHSITSKASSVKTSKFGILRSIYFAVSILTVVRSARRAAPPPPRARLRPAASVMCCPFAKESSLILIRLYNDIDQSRDQITAIWVENRHHAVFITRSRLSPRHTSPALNRATIYEKVMRRTHCRIIRA